MTKYLFPLLLMGLVGCSIVNSKTRKVENANFYWTIWFSTTSCDDGFDYQHGDNWVQSYDDSATAYRYYIKLRSTGKVIIWNKMKCIVDTTYIHIDKYSNQLHQYLKIKQP